MKKMKRLAALFLAVVMIMAMGMTTFAAPGDEGEAAPQAASYTIKFADDAVVPANHTYKVYQIFTGKLDSTGKILSDIEYGKNYDGAKNEDGTSKYSDAYAEAKAIDAADDANAFAASVTTKGDSVATLSSANRSATLPASGYYLVIDESTVADGTADQISKFIVNVGGDIEIAPKVSDVPGFDKKVNGQDATVDFAAGDQVPFTLTATMPEDVASYNSYQLTFTDTLSENLTFDTGSLSVAYKVGTADAVTYADSAYTLTADDHNITVVMNDIGTAARVANAQIIVSYTATLADDVASGEVASNSAELEFSNNGDSQGVGKTTTDVVKVYTFELNIDKVDEDGAALAGAGFTLYDAAGDEVETVAAGEDVTSFKFDGLKAGTYTLSETTVPDGYNALDDMTIVIGATVNGETVTVNDIPDWTKNGFAFSTEITNYAGVELPSTGGIGTTIFYVVGGILVLGAGVLLITKKRMSARN